MPVWGQAETPPDPASDLEDGEVDPERRAAFEQIARFTLAMEQIRRLHVEAGKEVDYGMLIDGAIEGMMSKLDPYSEYLENESVEDLRDETRGAFGGVGLVINRGPRFITVVSPVEDSPGWEAGLVAGDQIVAIEGESARGITVEEAVDRLRGEPGTEVRIRVRRPSENRSFDITLTRAVVKNRSVPDHRLLTDDIGYLRVKLFNDTTARLLRSELTELGKRGVKGVVLDLRGNPGGLLSSAIEVAGLFLPRETLVVYTRGKGDEPRREFFTSTRPHRLEPELAVLVNEGSASAAEIVSGALQDHGRAMLVGGKTFGKASVQSILPMPDGSALRLTTAQYFTPSDRLIQDEGIEPDVPVAMSMREWLRVREPFSDEWNWERDSQIEKAVELLRRRLSSDGDSEAGGED